jgi:hypothetical protein
MASVLVAEHRDHQNKNGELLPLINYRKMVGYRKNISPFSGAN